MINLTNSPLPSIYLHNSSLTILYRVSPVSHLARKIFDNESYAKLYCPSSSDELDPSLVIAAQKMGAALSDMSLTWGSVDGVRLAVMKKEWLHEQYQKFHDKGDGEWFVTTCLISGMEKDYAIALRTALLRALKLPLNADRRIEEVEKKWTASWNADAVHQEAEAILAGRRPKGVEIRYTGQTDPQWWLPGREEEKRPAKVAEKAPAEEQQRQTVPLTARIAGLFNAPGNQPKRPAAAPKKAVASTINTGGFS